VTKKTQTKAVNYDPTTDEMRDARLAFAVAQIEQLQRDAAGNNACVAALRAEVEDLRNQVFTMQNDLAQTLQALWQLRRGDEEWRLARLEDFKRPHFN
jgi:hypothetical protein